MSTSSSKSLKAAVAEPQTGFVLCLKAGDYEGELVVGKVYRKLPPRKADPRTDVRIVDESGEDYLYPAGWFVAISVPVKGRRAIA
jgi:hypothetical protein